VIAAVLILLAPVVLVLVRNGHPSMKSPFSRLLAVAAHDNAHARSQGWGEDILLPFIRGLVLGVHLDR
jgi:hypothetical protein